MSRVFHQDQQAPVAAAHHAAVSTAVSPRPALRGTLHGLFALIAPIGAVLLLLLADSPRGYVGAAIFTTSMTLLYWTSASYHLAPWPHGLRRVVMRIDHSMIFVLIAGTYTPFCLMVVGDSWGIPILSVVWTLAGLGILLKVCWPDAPRWLSVALYIGLGWIGIVAVWPVITSMPVWAVSLLAAGGLAYTVGAVVYAKGWPDPLPRVFGYHEVFHVLVVIGTTLHFSLIAVELL